MAAALAAGLAVGLAGAPASGVVLPEGFAVETFGPAFTNPTAMAIAPDGRVFVVEQAGRVLVLDANGDPLAEPFIDLREEVNGQGDRGMLGIALDPGFASNHRVYLAYTVDPVPGSPDESAATPAFGRIVRYTGTVGNRNVADPASRQVLLGGTETTGVPVCDSSHSMGMLAFGEDGSLLAATGDGAQFSGADEGGNTPDCLPYLQAYEDIGAFRAQNINSLCGKILRIDPDTGDGLDTNPYYNGNAQARRSKVYISGLRNPYRFAVRPGSGSPTNPGTLFIGDVGWVWNEELGVATAGQNLGWPCYEAFGSPAVYPFLDPANSGCSTIETPANPGPLTFPLIGINHSNPDESIPPGPLGSAITCGVFAQGSGYRGPYRNGLFFGDVIQSWIKVMRVDENNNLIDVLDFATSADGPVCFASDPVTGDILYISIFNGRLNRIIALDDPGDADGNGVVNVNDLLLIINSYGPCPAPPASCPADLNGSGEVEISDLLEVINNWG